MNIKTHTYLYIDHHHPIPSSAPQKFPPCFLFCKKRSLVASVPKISGGKVQRWSQASSTGQRCGWRLVALLIGFPRKTTWEVLLWRNFWLAKKEVSQVCFFLVWRCGGFFFGRKSSRKMFAVQSWNIYLSFGGCAEYGEKTLPQKLGMKKTHNSSKYGTHFTQKTSWNSSMEMLPDSSGSQ